MAAASLLPLGGLSLWVAREWPQFVELHYSSEFFPKARSALRSLSQRSPLPVAETLLLLLVLGALWRLWRTTLLVLGARRSLRNALGHGLSRLLRTAGLLYAFFLLSWGFNHARAPYAQHAGLALQPVQKERLAGLLEHLVEELGALRSQFSAAELVLEPTGGGLDARIAEAYERLAERVPALRSGQPILRRAWLSPLLSRLGIAGIYSPFSAEAHINGQIVPWLQPFVSAHEVAHFKGFAREDEANFIAWQVCRCSPHAAIRYSGHLVALGHVAGALESLDPLLARSLLEPLDGGVVSDLQENSAFWSSHHSLLTFVAESSNDAYLKSQGQAAGRESYGRMVELLIAEWNVDRGAEDID